MRLKQLEIKGFKSFADETIINFEADVIGIVGPNGSGKSNIVDAIRWVLGEQKTRELRLDTMSSVIFNGTKTRKAGGMASVSLTFENTKNLLPTDYHTVTITRVIYSSGESEYRLNNVACRLKDITTLFLDTGIGSNSYAIIALDMVDDILTDKENARRRMFEQAAGVSKYKIRKRETLNKLKSTTEDLDRIEDLLFEIDANLKSLEKQAKRTEKYFELKAQYKELSIQLATLKSASLKEQHKTLSAQIQTEEDRYRQLDVDANTVEAQLESFKLQNLDKEKAVSESQRDLNSLVGRIRGMENDRRMAEQKAGFIESNRTKLNQSILEASERLRQLEGTIDGYRLDLSEEKRIEARLEMDLVAAEDALKAVKASHGSLKSDLDGVMQNQNALEKAVFESEKQRAVTLNQIDNIKNEKRRSEESIKARSIEVHELQGKVDVLVKERDGKQKEVEALEKAEDQRKTDLQTLEQSKDQLTQALQKIHRELDSKRNEYKLTKSMVESLEGFPESIRFLSTSKNWAKKAPLLSDLIYVPESYRVAIENYLDPFLNYYVATDVDEAMGAIQLLNNSQKGKANFFLLDAFNDYSSDMVLMSEGKRASEVVECDPAYRKLIAYLLDKVIIFEHDEQVKQQLGKDLTAITQSGRIVRRAHSISGGSVGLFEGKKIGRKKNLEILEGAIKRLEVDQGAQNEQMELHKKQIEELKQNSKQPAISNEQRALNQVDQNLASAKMKLENFESFLQEVNRQQTDRDTQIKQYQEKIVAIDTDLETQRNALEDARSKISDTDTSFRQVAEELSAASTLQNQRNIEFIRQQNKVTTLQRELSFREKSLEETTAILSRDSTALSTSDEELGLLRDEQEHLEKQLLENYALRKDRESNLSEAEQLYFKAKGSIVELEDKLRKLSRLRQDVQVMINTLKDKFSEVRLQLTSIGERLRVEFGLSINDIINNEPDYSLNIDQLDDQVNKMKNRLDNYGEINPMAVEAYAEMKDRYDNISTQRNDILAAKDDLMETIKEIEETATTQFLEAFNQARAHFIEVFRSLFTADDACDLILSDPDNPLDSGIEIVAKPKGKRPQTINQLSGGEKTLTATALLFALYLLKPAPFCIFDEVDAPLDDTNVEKFNNIIKKFSGESQFIIVTHNKGTMAAVDTIYGVYMPEMGISRVSPVDFRTYDHVTIAESVK